MAPKNREEYFQKYRANYAKKRINITVSQEDFDRLSEAKGSLESLPAATLRLALERLDEKPKVPELNAETAQEVCRLMRTVANNINQIAHNMNMAAQVFGPGGHWDNPKEITDHLRNLYQDLAQQVTESLTGEAR